MKRTRRDKKRGAVVLLSGGIDSSTVLAIAGAEGYDLYALSFDYRQRHARELESAKAVARSLAVREHLIIAFDLREIGGSALTSSMEVPKSGKRGAGKGGSREGNRQVRAADSSVPATYVPARNTIFLSFALAWAEVLAAPDIFIGANAVDYSGYPDCRPRYLEAFEDMANLATKASVEGKTRFKIRSPLLFMTKGEIITKGVDLGLDYSLTWSCYDPQPASAAVRGSRVKAMNYKNKVGTGNSELGTIYVPCGKCDSCRFRQKGFREAGVRDPLLSVK